MVPRDAPLDVRAEARAQTRTVRVRGRALGRDARDLPERIAQDRSHRLVPERQEVLEEQTHELAGGEVDGVRDGEDVLPGEVPPRVRLDAPHVPPVVRLDPTRALLAVDAHERVEAHAGVLRLERVHVGEVVAGQRNEVSADRLVVRELHRGGRRQRATRVPRSAPRPSSGRGVMTGFERPDWAQKKKLRRLGTLD